MGCISSEGVEFAEYPQEFATLVNQGMAYDYSWHQPGENYLGVYEYIRCPPN
ncbi:MAG: hypothetical protein WA865_11210 [Spirulinaceae cyanobacterium]